MTRIGQFMASNFTLPGVLMLTGVLLVGIALSFGVLPRLLEVQPIDPFSTYGLLGVGLVLLALGGYCLRNAIGELPDAGDEEPRRSETLYSRHLQGIGFALLVDALLCSIVVSAFAWSVGREHWTVDSGMSNNTSVRDSFHDNDDDGSIDPGVKERIGQLFGESRDEARLISMLFLFSTMVALLGSLFYFSTTMWTKRQRADDEVFDATLFWAGLWFRIGEALVFNLVLFLVLRFFAPERFIILPLISLFVGMFLKSGEAMIRGLSSRVFAAFGELIPLSLKPVASLKMLTINLTEAEVTTEKMSEIKNAIENLKGVGRVLLPAKATTLQIEYDPARVTAERIWHEVTMHGVEL